MLRCPLLIEKTGLPMLLSVTGAPADASALSRFQEAYDSENQPRSWSMLLGRVGLKSKAAAAFDRVRAQRIVARQLKPLAAEGWLVLPSVRFEGDEADELDFFLLSPSGQAYTLLVQRYAGARMKASGSEVYSSGYRESLPQAVQDRSHRVRALLEDKGVKIAGLTPTAVLVDVESLRYWGPKSVIVTPDWKLVGALRKRERELQERSAAIAVRDERLLSPEFWSEAKPFLLSEYKANQKLHRRVFDQITQGRIFQRIWISLLIALGAGLVTWLYLSILANQQLPSMIMN